MKEYKSFLREATEKDLRGMGASDKQLATLKKRATRRGTTGFGVAGSSGDHFYQKNPTQSQTKAKMNKGSGLGGGAIGGGALARSSGEVGAKKGEDKKSSSAIVKTRDTKENQKDVTGFKRKGSSDRGYMSSPDTTTRSSDQHSTKKRMDAQKNKSKFQNKIETRAKKVPGQVLNTVRNSLKSGSGSIGTTGGGDSSERGVRYQ